MTNKELADRIVADLFQTGFGEQADRLVLMASDGPGRPGRDLGGWGRKPAHVLILRALDAAREET